jgi:uncharacterized membrane protein YtjA (UPF0391 family)
MLFSSLIFLSIAVLAAIFGFGGVATGAASLGKIVFVLFLIMFVASGLFGILRRRPRRAKAQP